MSRKDLIMWRGRIVPWITRWSGEVRNDGFPAGFDVASRRFHYGDETLVDRDQQGALWTRVATGPTRSGRPEFKAVHPYRQRRAMRECLCQVCGTKLDPATALWALKQPDADATGQVSMDPPACENCAGIAARACPALRRSGVAYGTADKVAPWGVIADFHDLEKGVVLGSAWVSYEDPRAFMGVARQQLMWIEGWHEVRRYTGTEVAA